MKKHLFFCLFLLLLTACSSLKQKSADEHEYVDLGLPSGTLWAACNVGATSPADYGDYFAWGETSPKEEYSWRTYKWCKGSEYTLTKYYEAPSGGETGNDIVLEREDDAATANWGRVWRMPTYREYQELFKECEWTWTKKENSSGIAVEGYLVVSKHNGESLFFPAAGKKTASAALGITIVNENPADSCVGKYWTSSRSVDGWSTVPVQADNLSFNRSSFSSIMISLLDEGRCSGYSVRPVRTRESSSGSSF